MWPRTWATLDIEDALAEIEKAQQLGGHHPDAEAMDRASRVLTGKTTHEDALLEIHRKYSKP